MINPAYCTTIVIEQAIKWVLTVKSVHLGGIIWSFQGFKKLHAMSLCVVVLVRLPVVLKLGPGGPSVCWFSIQPQLSQSQNLNKL